MERMFNTIVDNISTLAGKLGIFLSVRGETTYFLPKCKKNAFMLYEGLDGNIYWGIVKEVVSIGMKEYVKLYNEEPLNPNNYQGLLFYWLDNFWNKNEDN